MEDNKSTTARSFSLEQYKQMAIKFNKMSFYDKIITIQKNSDILALGSDGNWWGVIVKDAEIENELSENEEGFEIQNEWGSDEMCELVYILGIDNVGI